MVPQEDAAALKNDGTVKLSDLLVEGDSKCGAKSPSKITVHNDDTFTVNSLPNAEQSVTYEEEVYDGQSEDDAPLEKEKVWFLQEDQFSQQFRDAVNHLSEEEVPVALSVLEGIKSLHAGRYSELQELVDDFVEKAKHQPVILLPTNRVEMKDSGIETYSEFKNRTGSTDGKECLRQNWGVFLKAYTPHLDRDYLSTADLRRLDEQLFNRLKKQYRADEYHKVIPSLEKLNEQVTFQLSTDEKREIYRGMSMISKHLNSPKAG